MTFERDMNGKQQANAPEPIRRKLIHIVKDVKGRRMTMRYLQCGTYGRNGFHGIRNVNKLGIELELLMPNIQFHS